MEACVKFIKKHDMKKCFDTNNDVYLALLHICLTPFGPGLPSPASLIFSREIRDQMPN